MRLGGAIHTEPPALESGRGNDKAPFGVVGFVLACLLALSVSIGGCIGIWFGLSCEKQSDTLVWCGFSAGFAIIGTYVFAGQLFGALRKIWKWRTVAGTSFFDHPLVRTSGGAIGLIVFALVWIAFSGAILTCAVGMMEPWAQDSSIPRVFNILVTSIEIFILVIFLLFPLFGLFMMGYAIRNLVRSRFGVHYRVKLTAMRLAPGALLSLLYEQVGEGTVSRLVAQMRYRAPENSSSSEYLGEFPKNTPHAVVPSIGTLDCVVPGNFKPSDEAWRILLCYYVDGKRRADEFLLP